MSTAMKVFGIGMSKTGTTTLGNCLEVLGFLPHCTFEPHLKKWIQNGGDVERVLEYARRYRSFEDSPWYLLYKELDQRYPGSKFILTVRKNSLVHARSSWSHGVRHGTRTGDITPEYLKTKIEVYEKHNAEVMEYFRDRPDDLLVLCWENGDGWEKLCDFLQVPRPNMPIPHRNQGRYKPLLPSFIVSTRPYTALVRTALRISASRPVLHVKRSLRERFADSTAQRNR